MSERKYLSDLSRQIEKELPDVYWKKIGDTFGGHKRLDVFAFWQGVGFVIEFKMAGEKIPPAQIAELQKAERGAVVYVAEFFAAPGETSARHIRFYPFRNGCKGKKAAVTLQHYKGQYGLHTLFYTLEYVYNYAEDYF